MSTITGHTGLTALLGSPVAHSISPLMHNEAFRLLELDYVYLCFDVNEETLPAAVAGLRTCGIRGFNLTMPNKNKIVELHEELKEFVYGPTSFSSSYAMKLVKGGSIGDIYGKAFIRDEAGSIVYGTDGDYKGLPLVEGDGDTVKVGNANPDFMLGWNHSFSYKGFSLYFLLDWRYGGEVLSQTQAEMDLYGVSKATAQARDKGYVSLEGQQISDVKGFYKNVVGGRAGVTEYYMYDATNLRLREISLSYSFPRKWVQKTNCLKDLQLSFVARNLCFLYKKAPFDPDLVLSTGNDNQGIEVFGMPTTRSLGFTLTCEF